MTNCPRGAMRFKRAAADEPAELEDVGNLTRPTDE
jgi:hypothetical protein